MIEKIGDIVLTNQYWDCECEKNFIRPIECPKCPLCGSEKEDQPDSRIEEVFNLGFSIPNINLSNIPIFVAKQLGIEWLKNQIDINAWPEDDWAVLSVDYSLNAYIDEDGHLRATIFSSTEEEMDLENPIEVI